MESEIDPTITWNLFEKNKKFYEDIPVMEFPIDMSTFCDGTIDTDCVHSFDLSELCKASFIKPGKNHFHF